MTPASVENLFKEHKDTLYGWACTLSQYPEDLVQEAAVRALASDVEPDRPLQYVSAIMYHQSVREYAHAGRWTSAAAVDDLPSKHTAEPTASILGLLPALDNHHNPAPGQVVAMLLSGCDYNMISKELRVHKGQITKWRDKAVALMREYANDTQS